VVLVAEAETMAVNRLSTLAVLQTLNLAVVKRLLRLFLQKLVHVLLVWSIKRRFGFLAKSVVILLSFLIAVSYSTILSWARMCLLVHFPRVSSIHLTTIPAFCRSIPKAS